MSKRLKGGTVKQTTGGHFTPADEDEHRRASAGVDVPDYCANCHQPFMSHYNGRCPKDEEE